MKILYKSLPKNISPHGHKFVKGKWYKECVECGGECGECDEFVKTKITRLCNKACKITMINFIYEYLETMEDVRQHIQRCEGRHSQQVAYSTFHDCLTQICFGCQKIRTNKKIYDNG